MPLEIARRGFLVVAGFVVSVVLSACREFSDNGSGGSRGGHARRIVLVTCDTLRADHLSTYGYERPTSPRLDEFAKNAIVFENAYSSAPLTNPAISSLMSGRLPDEVGASPSNEDLMPADVVTLAELARDGGFDTAAFVANVVLTRPPASQGDVGIPQGFTHYDDRMGAHGENHTIPDRTARELTDAAIEWLDGRARDQDRFFLWLHYMDPHGPYTPTPEDAALFARDHAHETDLPLSPNHSGATGIPDYQVLEGRRKPGEYVDRYDGEIRGFDAQFGRLVDALEARGWLDDALVVFTADHGESLGEHGFWFCHGETLHRELVHVPLVVRPPRDLRTQLLEPGRGRRISRVATHLDVWPTVLEAAGLAGPPNRGLSLLTARLPPDRIAAHFLGRLDDTRHFIGYTDGRWHVIQDATLVPKLYDTVVDPAEVTDLRELHPTMLETLRGKYAAYLSATPVVGVRGPKRELDDAGRRAMRAMGYTEGGADAPPPK